MKIYILSFIIDYEGTNGIQLYKTAAEAHAQIRATTKQDCDCVELDVWDGSAPQATHIAEFYPSTGIVNPFISNPAAFKEYLNELGESA